jgi:hypothetical protein
MTLANAERSANYSPRFLINYHLYL